MAVVGHGCKGGALSAAGDELSSDGDGGATCAERAAPLLDELTAGPAACTVILRFDHDTLAGRGYQIVCGVPTSVSEEAARLAADADVVFAPDTLNPDNPIDEYVFFRPPNDDGAVIAVSAMTAVTVFKAFIWWDGPGYIETPDEWRSHDELLVGCGNSTLVPDSYYDLVAASQGGQAAEDPIPALKLALDTSAALALEQFGSISSAVTLRYPRTVGAFLSSTAEWVVLVNALQE